MKLNVSDLKKFKANSSSIKPNNILPILSYLKFDKKGTVTKNSLHSFVVQKIECNQSFLVEERILMSLVNYTSSPTIDIEIKDGKVIMSDGETKKTSSLEAFENFPSNENSDDKPIILDKEILESIGIASQFVVDKEIPDASCFVFVGKNHVCGSNGFIAYVDEFVEKVPEIVLSKSMATVISKYDSLKFSENSSYVFFETDDLKFGFSKPDFKFFDETKFGVFDSSKKFTINKSDFISLNDMVISDTVSKVLMASIEVKNNKMKFEMNDVGYEVNTTREFNVNGDDTDLFNFNPAYMNTILKSVPDTLLTFNQVENKYYITGDSGFVSLIIGLSQKTN